MPPARPRNIDDSRSETSSTITNLKERAALKPTSGFPVSKGKRPVSGLNGNKAPVNGNAAVAPAVGSVAAEAEKDLSLPRTDWNTIPVPILRTYRIAHRLRVPTSYNYPYAELTYKSCEAALRAPSVVHYRRKLRQQQLQRQRLMRTDQTNGASKSNGSKVKEKATAKDTAHAEKPSNASLSIAQSIEPPDYKNPSNAGQSDPSLTSLSTTSSTYLGPRRPPTQLASAVRKHFNAQQLVGGEADTIARFIYIVQQNGRSRQVRTEGSEGDGTGYWMGGNGREQRRVDGPGGEVGFRLRFRP